jgi:hypothetical protein
MGANFVWKLLFIKMVLPPPPPPPPALSSLFLAMGLKWHTVLLIDLNVEKLKEAQDSNSKSSISSYNKKYYSYYYTVNYIIYWK